MKKTRVLIADDHPVLRAGLRALLNTQSDVEVVGEASDGVEALRMAAELSPDIALMDLSMPHSGGLHAIERMREDNLPVRVLVLTMHDDLAYFRSALAMGVSGYVVKSSSDTELLAALRAVAKGGTYLNGALAREANQDVSVLGGASRETDVRQLSSREQEVLKLVAYGYTNRQIAEKIHISVKTVETYRSRVSEKLGLRTRADFTRYAIEMGIVGGMVADHR